MSDYFTPRNGQFLGGKWISRTLDINKSRTWTSRSHQPGGATSLVCLFQISERCIRKWWWWWLLQQWSCEMIQSMIYIVSYHSLININKQIQFLMILQRFQIISLQALRNTNLQSFLSLALFALIWWWSAGNYVWCFHHNVIISMDRKCAGYEHAWAK